MELSVLDNKIDFSENVTGLKFDPLGVNGKL